MAKTKASTTKSKGKAKAKTKANAKANAASKRNAKPPKPAKRQATKRAKSTATPITSSTKIKKAGPVDAADPRVAAIVARHPGAEDTDEMTALPVGRVEGHLVVDGRHFVVGDLEVTGAILVESGAKLFVTGDVRCANFLAAGDFWCDHLRVANTLYGAATAGSTWANAATGKIWLYGDHDFEFEDSSFVDKHDLTQLKPSHYNEAQPLPGSHQLSAAAVVLAVDRPRAYYEDGGPEVREADWWALLMADGVSAVGAAR